MNPEPAPELAEWTALSESLRRGLLIGAAVLAITLPPVMQSSVGGATRSASPSAPHASAKPVARRVADFGMQTPSPDVATLAAWVAQSRDNADADFVIVDKKLAMLYVFDSSVHLRGSSPVLLGAAQGDESVPGIGNRPIPKVKLFERTTPAGRFVAELGSNTLGEIVVWVDYDAAVSMHRVRATDPKERRLQRLATATPADNRISYGCINVPAAFFDDYVLTAFQVRPAIVYVLPDSKPMRQVFAAYSAAADSTIER